MYDNKKAVWQMIFGPEKSLPKCFPKDDEEEERECYEQNSGDKGRK